MEDDVRSVNVIDDKGQTGWTDTIRPTAQKQTTTVTNQQVPPARRFEVPGPLTGATTDMGGREI